MTDKEILAEEYGINVDELRRTVEKKGKRMREVFDAPRRESERDRRRNNQFRNIKSLKKK